MKLKEYFENLYKNDKLNHAFLICNTTFDNLKEDLNLVLSDYFFEKKIIIDENIDVFILKPQDGKILKDDIKLLQELFKTKSQYNKCKVYIIDGAEKMNDHAANALLKFLEEPQDGIYAFLISSNVDKVLPTIKSRCQILMVNNLVDFNPENYEKKDIERSVEFVLYYEKNSVETIASINHFFNKKEERDDIKIFIKLLKYFYRDCLNYILDCDIVYFGQFFDEIKQISELNDEKNIINKIMILNKYENMLEYNLNLNLFMDRLIIELEVRNNE